MDFGLTFQQIQFLKESFSRFSEVDEVLIFGSRAKGTYGQRSDVDLVISKGKLSLEKFARLKGELDESNFPYIIDLHKLSEITLSELLEHIHQFGKVIYTKK